MREVAGWRPGGLGTLAGILVLFLGSMATPAEASIRYVQQEIRGMDCAPCAYGMQKSLRKLDGVEDVQVSLNHAMGTITLAAENDVTFERIREVVRDGGFKPMEAKARVTGTVERDDGEPTLVTEDGRQYHLDVDARLRDSLPAAGQRVLVTVQVAADVEPVTRLRVVDISAQSE